MSYHDNTITFVGNLTGDPELRFTQGGHAVCSGCVANTRKGREGREDETTFLDFVVWRDAAENVAESLRKGDRVIVIGRLKKRSYENKEGQTVWVTEIEADEVAPSLRWARAQVTKSANGGGQRSAQVPAATADVPF